MIVSDSGAQIFDVTPSDQLNANTGLEDSEDTFLTLMLTQLQNQDPVDPMDNGEFLSQLAAFETASGIRDLEESFATLADALYASQTLQSASLVGRDVVTTTDSAMLENGEPVEGRVALAEPVEALTVEIADATGRVVRRLELGAQSGAADFAWDGRNDDGRQLEDGRYTVTALAGSGDNVVTAPVEIATRVDSVLLGGNGGVDLQLANGASVPITEVKEIS
jgi:flagellar basal-body rod modification protein FlgD